MPTLFVAKPLSPIALWHVPWRQWLRGAASWIRQLVCALHGHDLMMQFDRRRIYLQCTACGRQTPGWTL